MDFHMKALKTLLILTIVLILLFLGALLLRQTEYHQAVFQRLTISAVNQNTQKLFSGSARIDRIWMSRDLRIHGMGFHALLNSDQGPVAIEVGSFESTAPFYHYFLQQGLEFTFNGAKPSASEGLGFTGTLRAGNRPKPFLHLKTHLEGVDFKDVTWVNADNLSGATGQLKGEIEYRVDDNRPFFKGTLNVAEPGGKIQARFFDLFTPYLPKSQVKSAVKKIAAEKGLVTYQTASAEVSLLTPTELKVLLHILIPVYNLALNLNITIRLDDENAFAKIAQIAGVIKVTA